MATKLPHGPTPRPARGFSTLRAQKWVLTAAILTAIIYTFRRLVEPSVQSAPARGGVLSAGSPPPSLGKWAFAYGSGFLLLSVLSLGAPELAASFAMLMLAGEVLSNGLAIAADLQGVQNAPAAPASSTAHTAAPAGDPRLAGTKGTTNAASKGFTG